MGGKQAFSSSHYFQHSFLQSSLFELTLTCLLIEANKAFHLTMGGDHMRFIIAIFPVLLLTSCLEQGSEIMNILGPILSCDNSSSPTENTRPEPPVPVSPRNNALGVDTMQVRLEWSGGDLDEDNNLVYNLYFSADDSDLTKIASRLRDSSFVVFNLAPATTYFWQVIASDGMATSAGPVWRFTTRSADQ
jgi:hypothetical protein